MAGMKKRGGGALRKMAGGGEEGLRERWQGEGRRGSEEDGRYEEGGRGGGARRKTAGMKKRGEEEGPGERWQV